MTAKDFMLGSFVYNRDGEALKITELRKNQVMLSDDILYRYGDIEPIPLSPEILEKNGFFLIDKEDKSYRWEYIDGVFINADFNANEPFVAIHNRSYRVVPVCEYVHQLQNALRMVSIYLDVVV